MFKFKSDADLLQKDGLFNPASFLATRVPERKPPPWSQEYPEEIVKHPDPISLGGGMPNYGFFPIKSIDVNLKNKPFDDSSSSSYQVTRVDEDAIDLKNGLQYSNPIGLSHLHEFITKLIDKVNKPQYTDFKITVSSGNGNSINKVMDTILDEDDILLIDQYNYTPVSLHTTNFKGITVPLKIKDGQTDIEYLTNLLENWSTIYPEYRKPKAFYTIPNGSNPFGTVLSLEDKKKIYSLLEKHNFLIVEDDPYGYISLPKYQLGQVPKPEGVEEYLKTVGPSYLQLDTAGRVIRIETFSKIFAPGLRLSFIVGHERFINSIMLYSFVTTGQLASGPSQILLANTVKKLGGVDGFLEWVYKVRNVYVDRAYKTLKILYESKAFKEGKFKILEPEAGMFLTIFFDKDLTNFLNKTVENGVIVVNGNNMKIDELALKDQEDEKYTKFIRITIASLVEEELVEALSRLIDAIESSF